MISNLNFRLPKRKPPKTSAEHETILAETEDKLRAALEEQARIDAERGAAYFDASDDAFEHLQHDAARLTEEIKTLERAREVARQWLEEARRAEEMVALERRMAQTVRHTKKQHTNLIKIADLSEQLADLLAECDRLSEEIVAANKAAQDAGRQDLEVIDPQRALARLGVKEVPEAQRCIRIPYYWPNRVDDPPGSHYADLDMDAAIAEWRLPPKERSRIVRERLEAIEKQRNDEWRQRRRKEKEAMVAERQAREAAERKRLKEEGKAATQEDKDAARLRTGGRRYTSEDGRVVEEDTDAA